jgi:hypothetical protein
MGDSRFVFRSSVQQRFSLTLPEFGYNANRKR